MTTDKQALSFGSFLRAARLEKGISLQTVSQETMIGMDSLNAIEKEEHNKLPAEVFVKGFLRAYAKAVEADGDKAVRLYLSNVRALQETARFEADLSRSGSKFWLRLLVSLGILLAVIGATLYVISLDSGMKPGEKEPREITPPPQPQKRAPAPVEKPPAPKAPVPVTPPAAAKKLALKIMTIKETWMKVSIDGKSPIVHNLNPGDRLELEAGTGFNLLIGNAGGVKLTFNQKPLGVLGKNGQVVNVHLP